MHARSLLLSIAVAVVSLACTAGPTTSEAHLMCTRFAAERFSLPASARHVGYGDAQVTRSGDTFTVVGWSDMPARRLRWTCRTRALGGDRWELVSLT